MGSNVAASSSKMLAAVEVGSNSLKLVIVRADPEKGRWVLVERLNSPVVLGRGISPNSMSLAIKALQNFKNILLSHRVLPSHTRLVATSAVRESPNQAHFLRLIHQTLGPALQLDVLSGYEEARLIYLGILQFLPLHSQPQTLLTIDIGGGSTEFVIAKQAQILFATSLTLGHVTLTQQFPALTNNNHLHPMRHRVRTLIQNSGLIPNLAHHGFHLAIGSSGTIRAVEKAIFSKYAQGSSVDLGGSMVLFEGYERDWRFSKEELGALVESLCGEEGKVRRDKFFKRRSEFIVAGAVLLEEIFGMLGIHEMQVSGYALGEGLIAEKLAQVFVSYDLNANARWRSVVRLATRFNNKKRMKSASRCAAIAKAIFEGLRKWAEVADDQTEFHVSLDDKDLEYLEAACLLHNIGKFSGKKGYHKESYHIITSGDHLRGYNSEEVKLIALLARHHRKKLPKFDHASHEGFTKEVWQKFRILCVIIRLSAVIQKYQYLNVQDIEFSHSHEGYQLVLMENINQPLSSDTVPPLAADIESELGIELEHFSVILKQKLLVLFSRTSESSGI